MAVMVPRERWTDQRLDEFEKRVDKRFDQIDQRLDRMDADIRELRQTVTRMNENMNRNFIALAMLIIAAVVFF
jgi:prefoldin subunit 5